jgi:hypothetical protein
MQKDIKNSLRDFEEQNIEMSKNHVSKFEGLLMAELHLKKSKKKTFKWLSIAASVMLLVSLGIKFYPTDSIEKPIETSLEKISLGSISPEFQTIETYYTNSIKIEISKLELNDDNKEVIESYFEKIAELTKEYKLLTLELNTKGVSDSTIDALIRNLQLRLQLLKRLKKQLEQLKNLNTIHNEIQVI